MFLLDMAINPAFILLALAVTYPIQTLAIIAIAIILIIVLIVLKKRRR